MDHDKSLRSVRKTFSVKDGMAELYAGDLGEREMLKNFIQSGRETHCLCSGTPTYIGTIV